MHLRRIVLIAIFALLLASCNREHGTTYHTETLVAGSALHSPNGITFGPDGMLYAGSVSAQTIYRIDVSTGEFEVAVSAPDGEADDIAFAPDGTMVWTALVSGEIRALQTDESIEVKVSGMRLINPVDFTTDGRMFAGQVGFDRLYEFPPDAEPRLVASKMGSLNSFEITTDDRLYAPLADSGSVATIDIDTGVVTPIAGNLGKVVAVNLDSKGRIWTVDWASGDLWRIDPNADSWHDPVRVTTLQPPLDNLAIGPDDVVYVSRPAHSAIDRIDPETGESRSLIAGSLAAPAGLAIMNYDGQEALLVADGFGYRIVNTHTGAVTTSFDLTQFGFPGAATSAAVNADFFALTSAVIRPRVYLVDRASGKTVSKWSGLKTPFGIVLRDNGDPLVVDFSTGTLVGLSRSDKKQRDLVAEGLAGPVGLAWAGPDKVYVTEALGGRLIRIDLNDGTKTSIATEIPQPEGLTVMADGRVAIVAAGQRQLIAVDPANGTIEVLADDLPVNDPRAGAPAPVHLPSGVAQGADGSLYISGDRDDSILKLALN